MSELQREIVGPKRLNRVEAARSIWGHQVPEDTPISDLFTVDYWRKCSEQLKPGDRIECWSSDHKVIFEIFVLDSNSQADPPRVDLVWRAIYPPDLKVPGPVVAESRWRIKQSAIDGLWVIHDTQKDEVIANGLRREAAMQQVGLLEKLAREQTKAREAA